MKKLCVIGLVIASLICLDLFATKVSAYYLTKIRMWLIEESQIEDCVIGSVTPNTGAFTTVTIEDRIKDKLGNEITPENLTEVTEVLYVDGNRTDSYTANGSILKPFKTMQAAIAVASGDVLINVAPGTYDGDMNLGLHVVSIRGSGINATHFTGNITAGDRAHTLGEFLIKSTGSLTITDNIFASNLHLQCAVTVSGTGFLEGNMLYIAPSSGVVPLTISSTSGSVLIRSSIVAQGDVNAINQTAGTLVIFHSYATNNSLTTTTIDSSGGVCGLIDTSIGNAGFGVAVNMDNDGSALTANTLNGIVCSGNITCGTAKTYVEGLNFVGFGALSGTDLVYRPASRLSYDPAGTTLSSTNAQDAITEICTKLNAAGIAGF